MKNTSQSQCRNATFSTPNLRWFPILVVSGAHRDTQLLTFFLSQYRRFGHHWWGFCTVNKQTFFILTNSWYGRKVTIWHWFALKYLHVTWHFSHFVVEKGSFYATISFFIVKKCTIFHASVYWLNWKSISKSFPSFLTCYFRPALFLFKSCSWAMGRVWGTFFYSHKPLFWKKSSYFKNRSKNVPFSDKIWAEPHPPPHYPPPGCKVVKYYLLKKPLESWKNTYCALNANLNQ